jgi:hypothetical protein
MSGSDEKGEDNRTHFLSIVWMQGNNKEEEKNEKNS